MYTSIDYSQTMSDVSLGYVGFLFVFIQQMLQLIKLNVTA